MHSVLKQVGLSSLVLKLHNQNVQERNIGWTETTFDNFCPEHENKSDIAFIEGVGFNLFCQISFSLSLSLSLFLSLSNTHTHTQTQAHTLTNALACADTHYSLTNKLSPLTHTHSRKQETF